MVGQRRCLRPHCGDLYTSMIKADRVVSVGRLVASALRDVVIQVRSEYPGNPFLWAPFVHFGA
jgi:hypothetical protein